MVYSPFSLRLLYILTCLFSRNSSAPFYYKLECTVFHYATSLKWPFHLSMQVLDLTSFDVVIVDVTVIIAIIWKNMLGLFIMGYGSFLVTIVARNLDINVTKSTIV